MSEESIQGQAGDSRPEAARMKAKAVAKKAADKVEDAAEHVVEVVRGGFDKVIESIDELQKPKK